MGILYLIDNFSLGGAQTVVKGLMEHLAESRNVYAMALRHKYPETIIAHPNVTCYQSRSKYAPGPLKFLDSFIREKKIGTVHCQLPRSVVFGYILKRRHPQIRYIIHEQGDVFESRIYAFVLGIVSKQADGIIACSEATRKAMAERSHIPMQRVSLLYNFVDQKRFSPGKRHALPVERIAFAGRIEKRKGWREFVKAAEHFCTRSRLSFHMAGAGSEERVLLKMIGKQACPNISFAGYQGWMEEFYREMDLLVIPSHYEPMGMVAVEAMACGVPVLAADVPGLDEIVRDGINGWTYPAGSVSELIKAIETILGCGPEKVRAIIERGRKDAAEFSIEIFSGRLQEFYKCHSR